MNRKQKLQILFVLYILFVVKVIILKYPFSELKAIADTWTREVILEGLSGANFVPFKTIKMYIRYSYMLNSFENLVGNVVVFIPLGVFLPLIWPSCQKVWTVFVISFLAVCSIELFQLVSAFGIFDVDDIMLNTAGSMLGYIGYKIAVRGTACYRKMRGKSK